MHEKKSAIVSQHNVVISLNVACVLQAILAILLNTFIHALRLVYFKLYWLYCTSQHLHTCIEACVLQAILAILLNTFIHALRNVSDNQFPSADTSMKIIVFFFIFGCPRIELKHCNFVNLTDSLIFEMLYIKHLTRSQYSE